MVKRKDALPPSLAPRGLSRVEAAAYIGVSGGTFDRLVREGKMPKGFKIGSRMVWDRQAIDRAFDQLAGSPSQRDPLLDTLGKWGPDKPWKRARL